MTERIEIQIPEFLTVHELADLMEANPISVMRTLLNNGVMASLNQQIDFDTAAIVMEELGYVAIPEVDLAEEEPTTREEVQTWRQIYEGEDDQSLLKRPPVVTILGHVDHGKTTLLDMIRRTNVAEHESGGITQHIGAYQVQHGEEKITFLDTPGHEAFTSMRARGAQGADIAILIVAADDGVMPTTREALQHARAAKVPLIVAISKIDRDNANPEKVKRELAELDLTPMEWGGDAIVIPYSGISGEGIDELLDSITLVAEENAIVANPASEAAGIVLEAQVDKQRGTVATLLVMNGTLHVGDVVLAGTVYGRIKAMFDENGRPIDSAIPSCPVSVLGLNAPPLPGERFALQANEKTARSIAQERQLAQSAGNAKPRQSLEDLFAQFSAGERSELALIVKVDVLGSLQPITDSLHQMAEEGDSGITLNILADDVGNVSESDVMLASASKAIILGFRVRVDNAAKMQAQALGVDIRQYNIIYKLFEDIQLALQGMLEPELVARTIGVAEVRQIFSISRVGAIAGSYVKEGQIRRRAKARLRRGDEIIIEDSEIDSLKRFTEDVREVRSGFECGIGLQGVSEYQEGDIIEVYELAQAN
ncbi:MAG: translation initiation factor IF-2 [Anaerolineaceae bacterium]|nr:translation initiation factor IF-2 [Anaerolineaceae bacterium]